MEHVMEQHYDFDLTYITERIISVFFLPDLEEHRYCRNLQEVASMLKSKHQAKFLLLNLSEKRHDITRLNPKVQDYGWPDLHAPPLDRICAVCKAMETWLTSDPHNVVVLHCRGNKGKTGVIVAAYMHYSKISAGADQALTTLAMRKFCEDKVSSSLMPSQNRFDCLFFFRNASCLVWLFSSHHVCVPLIFRYIYYFGGLLSGIIKMNSSPLFLHQILIPSLPNFQAGGGFFPFLKIYQSLQLVYTSGVYDPQSSRARKLCVTMEPALLLKGDILVKCYHRRSQSAEREVVFRVQFHTCTVHGAQLWFGKTELDVACTDDRFPPDATVEFIFSGGPEKTKGREDRKSDTSIKVDYNTLDPVVRWDSYENFNLHYQDSIENISHTRGPLDGSLYAQVRKRRGPGWTASAAPNGCLTSSPTVKSQTPNFPQPLTHPSESNHSSFPSSKLEDPSLSLNCPQRELYDSSLKSGDVEAKEKHLGAEKDRETDILDDPLSPGVLRRESSCCGQAGMKCSDIRWMREREPCLSGAHCLSRCSSIKNHPKSQTLPALPTKPVSPPSHSAHLDLCHRHSVHPLPELQWEYPPPPPPLPCLLRPFYPFSNSEQNHPHSHTLPVSNRLCTGEEGHIFHFSGHSPSSHLSNHSLPSSPYREIFFNPPPPSSGCPCRDCFNGREHQPALVRTFHPLHSDQLEGQNWSQGTGLQQPRQTPPLWESENQWEVSGEAEICRCKPAMPVFHMGHPSNHSQTPDHPRYGITAHQGCPAPHSQIDVQDGTSSGYQTPQLAHHSCPCSSYQSSPVESHESRGYVSGYHSGSASPLLANTPSPVRSRLPESCSVSKDHHAEQHKDISSQSKEASTLQECGTNTTTAPVAKETQTPTSSTSVESTQPSRDSLNPDGQLSTVKIAGGSDQPNQKHTSNYATVFITPVQVQLNGSALPSNAQSDSKGGASKNPSVNLTSSASSTSPISPICSPELQFSSDKTTSDVAAQRLTPDGDSTADTKPPSPVPDGYHTPTFPLASYYYPLLNVPRVPYTGYTAVTIPANQPPLPEKKRLSAIPGSAPGNNSLLRAPLVPPQTLHVTFSPPVGEQNWGSAQQSCREETDIRVNAKFVQDSSKFWYKPGISRDQAIAVLKDKEPGTFLIRDSNSFQGAYGLALKVATPPPNANIIGGKGDPLEQLVRHFLIETGPRGVKIKGCQNESYFGSLSALVYQHSITPISLPCAL
ncbi:unnamed protein product, partial [Tetraodon nigroviridis]